MAGGSVKTDDRKGIEGYGGRYVTTNEGQIISLWRRLGGNRADRNSEVVLRPTAHWRTGHLRVCLFTEGRIRVWLYVHVLIAHTWHGPPPSPFHIVRHLDDCPANNKPSNLIWGTHSENAQDRERAKRQRKQEEAFLNDEAWWSQTTNRFMAEQQAGTTFSGLDVDTRNQLS